MEESTHLIATAVYTIGVLHMCYSYIYILYITYFLFVIISFSGVNTDKIAARAVAKEASNVESAAAFGATVV